MDKVISSSGVNPPRFFWRGVLILLPMAVLTVVALYSLRQDRLLAEQDAKELGGATAMRMAQAISKKNERTEIKNRLRDYREANFSLNANRTADLSFSVWAGGSKSEEAAWQRIREWQEANPGIDLSAMPVCDCRVNIYWELSSPQIYPLSPTPPDWLSELSPEQRRLWQEAQRAEFVVQDPEAAQTSIKDFIAAKPPDDSRANAEFELLLLKTRGLKPAEAEGLFAESRWSKTDQLTEAGLPVGQLICYRALQLLPDHAGVPEKLFHSIAWAIEYRASILSPRLIAEAERVAAPATADAKQSVATLRAWWESDERAREVLRDFQGQHPLSAWTNGLYWTESSSGNFLLAPYAESTAPSLPAASRHGDTSSSTIHILSMFPQAVVAQTLEDAVTEADVSVPPYAMAVVELGGKELELRRSHFLMGTPSSSLQVLGDATGLFGNPLGTNVFPFHVRVYLADRDALYARQHQRTILFGAVILASFAAALIGFVSAYRGFHQQLRLSEMKSNFVSSVSHELRAPIASMRLLAESLERGKIADPVKQKQYFGLLVGEARRLAMLTENILDFSRIERGSKKYEFEPANVGALAADTVQLMRPCAAERQVELDLRNSGGEGAESFACDALALQQALINLIDNAVKHSPPGGRVVIGVNNGAAGVSLWVEDHGPGIPTEEHEKIFERFYRRGSELRRETQGIGIGLTIVQHIVEAHGGRVMVRSAPGQGSRFTIELPKDES